jgi:pyruvate-ferredoxin/flavodoxin oxidoreductase
MMRFHTLTTDGNEAAASIAFRSNEVIAIYPITPSSTMGELCDKWAVEGKTNVWGQTPSVQEMQSEGGAAGAVHGSLQAGALTTTFTSSQGLLLMIPNMYKIAGELTPAVFHIAARSLATQALSIFGDHSDVMSARAAGWAMLFGGSVQEAHDLALISHAATLKSRIPFLHIFDGFRTSHEVSKIQSISDEIILKMMDPDALKAFRDRALTPENPVVRGTAMNPDLFFQARESSNRFYDSVPGIVQQTMDEFGRLTGRQYRLFDYVGPQDAERVIVVMGSAGETVEETLQKLNRKGEKVGLVKVKLYRPFDTWAFVQTLPATVRAIAVLDRTKEPGAGGEPLYKDVLAALAEHSWHPRVIGGRFGLSSKEFTPAMVKAVYDELLKPVPKNHFTVGITDDVTFTNLDVDPEFHIEAENCYKAIFWGLGSDGTVGANKSTIKILGEKTRNHVQGYFVYDSKKSGSVTISHLRFGSDPIKSAYLIQEADFVAVHNVTFLDRYPVLERAARGATVLLNSPIPASRLWDQLPQSFQEQVLAKDLRVFAIDAQRIARDCGLGGRINTVMQVAFFRLSEVIPFEQALQEVRGSISKSYGKRGSAVVEKNLRAIDMATDRLEEVPTPGRVTSDKPMRDPIVGDAPAFVRNVLGMSISGRGDDVPVSAMPVDGTYPSATSRYEKRGVGLEAPVWNPDLCIQCGKCVLVCPHAVIRAKVFDKEKLADAPGGFQTAAAKWKEGKQNLYTIQVSVEDCTGCSLCVDVCPAADKVNPKRFALDMQPADRVKEETEGHWPYFLNLPDEPAFEEPVRYNSVKNVQLLRPLFEFSGACSGCGETPYLKLLSQLFGDHAMVANATGCSSIYGGNLPTTPWAKNQAGRGPAWANSLFEDNAEFGFGMRIALDMRRNRALKLLAEVPGLPQDLRQTLTDCGRDLNCLSMKRDAVHRLRTWLLRYHEGVARELEAVADALIDKSVWIVGGDGWAYDIDFGGLDHVLAQGRNVNLLVMDTEVYSNTGGQASKATPLGASAVFAAGGKTRPKKDLGFMMMSYGNVYVAQVAMGANDAQCLKAFQEADAYDGPSLIIAYGHCIAHGMDMHDGLRHQKLAVDTGYWPLYRFHPEADRPLTLDSKEPSRELRDYLQTENRFSALLRDGDETAKGLMNDAQRGVTERWRRLERMTSER